MARTQGVESAMTRSKYLRDMILTARVAAVVAIAVGSYSLAFQIDYSNCEFGPCTGGTPQ
jgi:hypothetical protein